MPTNRMNDRARNWGVIFLLASIIRVIIPINPGNPKFSQNDIIILLGKGVSRLRGLLNSWLLILGYFSLYSFAPIPVIGEMVAR